MMKPDTPLTAPPHALAPPGLGTGLARALGAARPAFFAASALPVLVGSAWAAAEGHYTGTWLVLSLIATVLAHGAVNLYNDIADDANGADAANLDRISPYTGGSRYIQSGLLSRRGMKMLATAYATGAVGVGTALAMVRGPGVALLGAIGLAIGYAYSAPRLRLCARGIGELAVAIGLGALPVLGSAWLQGATIDAGAVTVAVIVSAWVGAILVMNEVPDAVADARVGKRTLVVRLGIDGARRLYHALTLVALGAGVVGITRGDLPGAYALAAIVLAMGSTYAAVGLLPHKRNRSRLRHSIELTIAVHGLGCLALAGAILLAR